MQCLILGGDNMYLPMVDNCDEDPTCTGGIPAGFPAATEGNLILQLLEYHYVDFMLITLFLGFSFILWRSSRFVNCMHSNYAMDFIVHLFNLVLVESVVRRFLSQLQPACNMEFQWLECLHMIQIRVPGG